MPLAHTAPISMIFRQSVFIDHEFCEHSVRSHQLACDRLQHVEKIGAKESQDGTVGRQRWS
jgi:hypothetical protein